MTGYLEIIAAGVIWATTGPFVRHLKAAGWSPLEIVLGRAVFASFFMGLWLIVLHRRRQAANKNAGGSISPGTPWDVGPLVPRGADFGRFLLLGIVAVMFSQLTYFYALSVTTVAVAVTLNYTAPFFVLGISLVFLGEKLTREKLAALAMAFAGVVLISGLGEETGALRVSPLGFLAGLVSGASYGAQTVVYKKLGRRYGPVPLNFWTMLLGGVVLLGSLLVLRGGPVEFVRSFPPTWRQDIPRFAFMGLGPGTLAFILFADGINKVEATRGSIAALSEPLAAYLIGYFFLGESLSLRAALGASFVVSAIWIVSSSQRTSKRQVAEEMPADTNC